ncbi:unnamed protein product, partial [Durusdinium trenchii]
TKPTLQVEEFCKDMISDSAWKRRQDIRKQAVDNVAAGFTVSQWCDAVRATKRQGHRVFVWMHFFAGRRQDGDVEEFAQKLAEAKGLQLMYISIDLATDHRWDLTIPCTFHALYQLVEEGLVDGVLGEPPCSTVASSRHVPLTNGPRPLRFRHCFWGREDLKLWERARVLEANCLWLNYMSLCEGVSSRGGVHLFAHPADPGVDPYPSLWQTAEMINMERRTGAIRVHLHPCHYGGPEAKLTCLSGTAIAKMFIDTFVHFEATNTGPTGALRLTKDVAAPRVTAWSTWCEQRRHGAVLLNEATVRRQAVVLSPLQSAVYVHVDDTVCLSDASQGPIFCDKIMEDGLVSALEEVGFGVSQQERNDSATKVVGYEVIRNPAGFRLPIKKMVLLMEALKFVASCKMVRIRVLHARVGVWVFGALLRRELLSVPQAVFSFLTFHEEAEEKEATWWPSARREVLAMARLVPLMTCRVGSPLPQWLFATDAMGANELDSGGYGIVMTKITEHEALDLLRQSNAEGRAIAGLDGMRGAKFPGRALTPTVPFTLLSEELFCPERWVLVESGRWRFSEHITLGESRTVVKLLRKIAAVPELHGSLVLSLQDNRPTACSMTKGHERLGAALLVQMATGLRANSAEPKVDMHRPDLRKRENRYLLPQAPDGLSKYQKQVWRNEQLQQLMQPSTVAGAAARASSTPPARLSSAPRAGGEAGGVCCQRGGRRSPSLSSRMWRGGLWIFKGASGFPFLLIIAMLSGNHGPIHQTARILGTVADLSEAATSTAITAINASSTMATAASTLMVQAASNGLDASANMWHGVDVTDIYANKCGGAVITSSVPALTAWLNTDAAMVHFPCLSPFLVTRLKSAAMSITTEVPYTQAVSEELQLNDAVCARHSLRLAAISAWGGVVKALDRRPGNRSPDMKSDDCPPPNAPLNAPGLAPRPLPQVLG